MSGHQFCLPFRGDTRNLRSTSPIDEPNEVEARQIMVKNDALLCISLFSSFFLSFFYAEQDGEGLVGRETSTVLRQTLGARAVILVARQRALCYHGCPSLARQSRTRQGTGINVSRPVYKYFTRAEMVPLHLHRADILSPFKRKKTRRIVKSLAFSTRLAVIQIQLLLFARARPRFPFRSPLSSSSGLLSFSPLERTDGRKKLKETRDSPLTAAFNLSKLARVSGTGPKCITILSRRWSESMASRRAMKMPV